ncbi:hypothetical protein ACJJIR_19890 [Microbulbifer sp. SSSA008]|uniref:hypothetical protein n=1 Tax=Microbulbifer sp. SSSA008 TaxID=3243380 RepID=UPI00403902F4
MKGCKKPSRSIFSSGIFCIALALSACSGGGGSGSNDTTNQTTTEYNITTSLGDGGDIEPKSVKVGPGRNAQFNITLDEGYVIESAAGCGGNLVGTTYTTSVIADDCEISVIFKQEFFRVTTVAGPGGKFQSDSLIGKGSISLHLIPDSGYVIDQVSGCSGTLDGNIYKTGQLIKNCEVSATFKRGTTLDVSVEPTKSLYFTWVDTPGASHYKLHENVDGQTGFVQVGEDITQGTQNYKHIVPLFARVNASYFLEICFGQVCESSNTVYVRDLLANGIGEIYPENYDPVDGYLCDMQISSDHSTLAISPCTESSSAAGINSDSSDESFSQAGAVYIFSLKDGEWLQEAYIKPTHPGNYDHFGYSIDLSANGSRLVVGAPGENSLSTGINGDSSDDSGSSVGAVYIFEREHSIWSQVAYLKPDIAPPSNERRYFGRSVSINDTGTRIAVGSPFSEGHESATGNVYIFELVSKAWGQSTKIWAKKSDSLDQFGESLEFDSSGNILLIGAIGEDSASGGVNGDESNNSENSSGAAYIFKYDGIEWLQRAYLKPTRAREYEHFGEYLTISGNGKYIAIGSKEESSRYQSAGATYVYHFDGETASQAGLLRASNPDEYDKFGSSVSLNYDGSKLLVSAPGEDSYSSAFSGNQNHNYYKLDAGALYLFSREGNSFTQSSYIKSKNVDEFKIINSIISQHNESIFTDAYKLNQEDRGRPLILVY